MKVCLRALAFLLAVGSGSIALCAANEPCENIEIPRAVSVMLQQSYPHWRVEKTSDLEPTNQEAWLKKYPGSCPGFVAGHFRGPDSTGYAFLLLPSDETKKGYRVVVLLESAKDRWRTILLEKGDENTPNSATIGIARAGEYREAEGSKKIHIGTEAIFSEDMGAGVIIYYWHVDRFRSIVISD
jgi:hypothetical protein